LQIGCTSAFQASSTQTPQTPQVQIARDTAPGVQDEEAFTLDDAEAQDKAPSFLDRLEENLRLNVDVYSRGSTTHQRGQASWLNAVGLDLHKVFSAPDGDIGTLVLQPFLARRDNAIPVPHHTDGSSDWEIELHDFYFNLRRWGRGRTNIKVGHFDIPFGLEPTVDTHVRLHQLISNENIGMKKDWGVSINGELPKFDYEISLTQGSGHEWINKGKNHALAARIGTPGGRNFVAGASVFHGRILGHHGNLMRRSRVGVDAAWKVEQFTLRSEASMGQDSDNDVLNALAEVNWNTPDQKFEAYLQGVYLGSEATGTWDEKVQTRVGGRWQMSKHFSLSAQYSHDIVDRATEPADGMFTIQLRFYY
jgi:hypothetical protein